MLVIKESYLKYCYSHRSSEELLEKRNCLIQIEQYVGFNKILLKVIFSIFDGFIIVLLRINIFILPPVINF